MDVEVWETWIRILRDLLIVGVGTFMLIFETVFTRDPNAYVIAAGLAALGLPPALRLDLRTAGDRTRRRRMPDPNEPEEDERWSHLP